MDRWSCRFFIWVLMLGLFCSCEEIVSPPSDESGQFWEVLRDPQVYYYWITGSSGSPSSGIYIVNQNGIVLFFKDAECRILPSLPAGRDWNGIWANSHRDIFAVGSGGAIARYEGGRWREQSSGTSADLYHVWGSSGEDVWAVGDSGTILHYDGSGWNAIDSGADNKLYDVRGLDGGPVFVVGEGGTIVEVRGPRIHTIDTGMTNSLYAIGGTSEIDLCAVGANGTILQYDGRTWTGVRSGIVTGLTSVCDAGKGHIYAAGGTTIIHNDGRAWEPLDSGFEKVMPGSSGIVDLYADVSGRLLAVGRDKIYSFDKGVWKTIELPPSDEDAWTIYDVWGSGPDDVFALGGCAVMRREGIDWGMFMNVSGMGLSCELHSLSGISPSNIYTVGSAPLWDDDPWRSFARGDHVDYSSNQTGFLDDQGMLIVHYDDTGLHVDDIGSIKGDLFDVWGASENDVFVVGKAGSMWGGPISGAILRFNGLNWDQMQSNTTSPLFRIWGSSGNDVFAVGEGGAILHYNGIEWSPQESGVDASLTALWGSGPSDVFAIGSDVAGVVILHYDGIQWSVMNSPEVPSLYAVWGTSGENVFAVGDYGTILRYDGEQWTAMDSPTGRSLYSIWGSSVDDIFVAGENGIVLHHGVR